MSSLLPPISLKHNEKDIFLYVFAGSVDIKEEKALKAKSSLLNENINHLNKAHMSVHRFMPRISLSAPYYKCVVV